MVFHCETIGTGAQLDLLLPNRAMSTKVSAPANTASRHHSSTSASGRAMGSNTDHITAIAVAEPICRTAHRNVAA